MGLGSHFWTVSRWRERAALRQWQILEKTRCKYIICVKGCNFISISLPVTDYLVIKMLSLET
jgi:hypothetical protein